GKPLSLSSSPLEPIGRRELAVLVLNVGLGERHIAVRHLEVRVAQKLLQGKHISPCPQELHPQSMPERVRRAADGRSLSGLAQPLHQLEKSRTGERFSALRHEERIARLARIVFEIGPEGSCRGSAKRNGAVLVALAEHDTALPLKVYVPLLEAAQFRGA